jgi:transposase-like protein
MSKKGKRGVRYTAEKKAAILEAAKKEGLSGAQVAKRFGIASLTFYKWRGPVRSDAVARRGGEVKRGPGRPKGSRNRIVATRLGNALLRDQVRAEVRKVLPAVIRQEVESFLKRLLG